MNKRSILHVPESKLGFNPLKPHVRLVERMEPRG